MTPQLSAAQTRARLVAQFFHVEKLPVFSRAGLRADDLAGISARLADASSADLADMASLLAEEASAAASQLLAAPDFAAAVSALPFDSGEVVVALGDSITDDAVSWAHLLERVLSEVDPTIIVRNHGITGNTTGEVLHRLDTIARDRPHWVIQMIGTNDARRHGGIAAMTTSSQETARNLRLIDTFVAGELGAAHIRMTPPPTLDARVRAWAPFAGEGITWHADDVSAVADIVRAEDPAAVDIHSVFTREGAERLLLADGVHPNLEGQKRILRALVESISSSPSHNSSTRQRGHS